HEQRVQLPCHRCQPTRRSSTECCPRIDHQQRGPRAVQAKRKLCFPASPAKERPMERNTSRGPKRPVSNRIVVPQKRPRRFYGHGVPGADLQKLAGKLIVVEGADGSGRSTQIVKLVDWLEASGHATVQVGLKRSTLVSEELEKAQEGNI